MAKSKVYHSSGSYITYSIKSGKSPYIIFLHGLMSNMNGTKAIAIEKFLKTLGNGYIRFDCRGHGGSDGKFSDFGITDWSEDASLIISTAKGSCGCTVPEWPKEPIAKAEEGIIKVTFNSAGRSGKQNKKVTLVTNAIPNTKVITLTGNVIVPEKK